MREKILELLRKESPRNDNAFSQVDPHDRCWKDFINEGSARLSLRNVRKQPMFAGITLVMTNAENRMSAQWDATDFGLLGVTESPKGSTMKIFLEKLQTTELLVLN